MPLRILVVDDDLTKPFSPRELVARVHAVLRRHGVTGVQRVGDIEIDRDRRTVSVAGRTVDAHIMHLRQKPDSFAWSLRPSTWAT